MQKCHCLQKCVNCFKLPTVWEAMKQGLVLYQHPPKPPKAHCAENTSSASQGQNSVQSASWTNLAAQLQMNRSQALSFLLPIFIYFTEHKNTSPYMGKCLIIRWDHCSNDGGDQWWKVGKEWDVHRGKHWLGKSWVLSKNILFPLPTHWTALV